MTNSRHFDRAARFYDQTRPLPEPIATLGIQAIVDLITPGGRVLDIGTGTGRISIPLLERELDLIGFDLSGKMLRRLKEKRPAARVVQADASHLPFLEGTFEDVLTVHVLHLIPSWRDVLREIRRVLKPGGTYLNVRTWGSTGTSIRECLRLYWRDWLDERGVNARNPGLQDSSQLVQELDSMGAHVREVEVTRYSLHFTVREELGRFTSRTYSDAWDVPDELFDASMKELFAWAESEYADLDQPRADEVRMVIEVTQFEI